MNVIVRAAMVAAAGCACATAAFGAERAIASSSGTKVPVFRSVAAYCSYIDLVAAHGGDDSFDTGDPASLPYRRLLTPGTPVDAPGPSAAGTCHGRAVSLVQIAIPGDASKWYVLPGNLK